MRRLISTLLCTLILAGCVTTNAPLGPREPLAAGVFTDPALGGLIERIDTRFSDPTFAHAHWGVLIQSLDTGLVWYERDANRLFLPASNQKILTTAAALTALGPDFTFETTLFMHGQRVGDTIEGDLVVWGNGDPTLYERFFDDSRDVFRAWARDLRAQGIVRITGSVIGDDNAWDDVHIGEGWAIDNLPTWAAAEHGPLQINENYIDFMIHPPAEPGGEVTIVPNLPSAHYRVINQLAAVEHGRHRVQIDRAPGSNTIIFRGEVIAGQEPFERSPTISNPTLFYVTVLTEVLEEEGITVEGAPRDIDLIFSGEIAAEDLEPLETHTSPPLSEILGGLMKRSQNMYAETMIRTMGWQRTGLGTFEAGREVLEEVLSDFGVQPGTYAFADGSGLTRYNWVSPRQIVDILRGMRNSSNSEIWRDLFPVAGVDGTLRSRMRGTAAEGNVRAKTGSISQVRSLSGYVTTADGEELVFSFLVNGSLMSSAATDNITDDVLAMIASLDRAAH